MPRCAEYRKLIINENEWIRDNNYYNNNEDNSQHATLKVSIKL